MHHGFQSSREGWPRSAWNCKNAPFPLRIPLILSGTMDMKDLVTRSRSYRGFDGSFPVDEKTLREFVSLARMMPSARNSQPLKFVLACAPDWNARIFETLKWAGYLTDWPGPVPAERPTAYIVVLVDRDISQEADIDVGIAAQTILLGATERGLGGCMLGAVKRDLLAKHLGLPPHLAIALVLAIGKPKERIVLEDLPSDRSIKYYRDADGGHHVPKRALDELIFAVHC
jgi:nitroreductase